MLVFKIATIIQTALYCQPDAKIANGIYWFNFWLNVASKILN